VDANRLTQKSQEALHDAQTKALRAVGRRRGDPGPVRGQGPAPADRVAHLPGPHRRREDRAGPPGYVGFEEGGQLTEAVRRKPYSVVLFDEIEKAHPDVFNTLLQVLDDGRLTDAQGRTVNFRNAVIIMTSNIGSEYLLEGATADGEIKPDARDSVLAELRRHFRPEFLNRVDDIVLFKPLTQVEIERIVELMLDDLRTRLAGRRIVLETTGDARRFLARQGFDPVYGARPLRRFIAREVETRIGRALLTGDIADGATIRVEVIGSTLAVMAGRSSA
jgi:ATP-dependent Clp protease ATP-binding subunit ClpB